MSKPAFPRPGLLEPHYFDEQDGMSLLEYYAGQALIGYLSSPTKNSEVAQDNSSVLAMWCFENAEAMIKEAKKRSKNNG